jgi:hypothetical protein
MPAGGRNGCNFRRLLPSRDLTVTFEATSGLVASGKKAGSNKALTATSAAPEVQFRTGAALTVGGVEVQ